MVSVSGVSAEVLDELAELYGLMRLLSLPEALTALPMSCGSERRHGSRLRLSVR